MALENQFDFFKEFGLEDVPDEKKEEMQMQIMELITSRFNRVVLLRLSEEDKQSLDKLLEGDDAQKADQFIAEKVPDYQDIYKQIVEDLKEEMSKIKEAVL